MPGDLIPHSARVALQQGLGAGSVDVGLTALFLAAVLVLAVVRGRRRGQRKFADYDVNESPSEN